MSNEVPTYEGQRQWVLLALFGGELTASQAAGKMSILEKAEASGEECPDVRYLPGGSTEMLD